MHKSKLKMAQCLKTKTKHSKTPRKEHRQTFSYKWPCKYFLRPFYQGINRKRNKNRSMGPKQPDKHLHSKGNQDKIKKTTYRMGENSCKGCNWQGLHLQNIPTTHNLKSKTSNNPSDKQAEKTYIDISPEKTYRWATDTGKIAQHHYY